jgi:hypothetical protein
MFSRRTYPFDSFPFILSIAFVAWHRSSQSFDKSNIAKKSIRQRSGRTLYLFGSDQWQDKWNVRLRVYWRCVPRCFSLKTTIRCFFADGLSVFTKNQYPAVLRDTGIHFLNLPCQTTSWFPNMSCPMPAKRRPCSVRSCSERERRENELKCNTPVCEGQEPCIPVYFTPAADKTQVCDRYHLWTVYLVCLSRKFISIHKLVLLWRNRYRYQSH